MSNADLRATFENDSNRFQIALFALLMLSVAVVLAAISYLLMLGENVESLAVVGLFAGAIVLFFPRICFWLMLLSLAIGISASTSTITIHPYDLAMALLIVAFLLDYLIRVDHKMLTSPFDFPFFLLALATVISAIFAYDRTKSIVPMIRLGLIYASFRIVYKVAREISTHSLIKKILYGVTVLSLMNCMMYLWTGGEERIFGMAGGGFRTFSMTALPMAFAFLLWSDDRRGRWRWGSICFIIGLALIATQSRAPLIALFGALFWMIVLLLKMKKLGHGKRIAQWTKRLGLPLLLLILLMLTFSHSLFSTTLERYYRLIESIHDPESSIAMRYLLWKAAWKAFVAHPVVGIGIGNFSVVERIFPEVTLASLWFSVSRLSAHNVVLHYMAETGILGALSLIFLAFRGVAVSYRAALRSISGPEGQASFAIYGALLVFAMTIFFMEGWMWGQDGYVLGIIFGLAAARRWEIRRADELASTASDEM